MLSGQPNHGWQFCFPLLLHASGSDFRLVDGSDFKTHGRAKLAKIDP